jgi:cell division protein FtsB
VFCFSLNYLDGCKTLPKAVALIFHLCYMRNGIKLIANKYLIATAIFMLLLLFADKGNVFDQYKLYTKYSKVKSENEYYKMQIEKARKDYNELFTNDRNLEKFAREKYLMKRDDEDVFVIEMEE